MHAPIHLTSDGTKQRVKKPRSDRSLLTPNGGGSRKRASAGVPTSAPTCVPTGAPTRASSPSLLGSLLAAPSVPPLPVPLHSMPGKTLNRFERDSPSRSLRGPRPKPSAKEPSAKENATVGAPLPRHACRVGACAPLVEAPQNISYSKEHLFERAYTGRFGGAATTRSSLSAIALNDVPGQAVVFRASAAGAGATVEVAANGSAMTTTAIRAMTTASPSSAMTTASPSELDAPASGGAAAVAPPEARGLVRSARGEWMPKVVPPLPMGLVHAIERRPEVHPQAWVDPDAAGSASARAHDADAIAADATAPDAATVEQLVEPTVSSAPAPAAQAETAAAPSATPNVPAAVDKWVLSREIITSRPLLSAETDVADLLSNPCAEHSSWRTWHMLQKIKEIQESGRSSSSTSSMKAMLQIVREQHAPAAAAEAEAVGVALTVTPVKSSAVRQRL